MPEDLSLDQFVVYGLHTGGVSAWCNRCHTTAVYNARNHSLGTFIDLLSDHECVA